MKTSRRRQRTSVNKTCSFSHSNVKLLLIRLLICICTVDLLKMIPRIHKGAPVVLKEVPGDLEEAFLVGEAAAGVNKGIIVVFGNISGVHLEVL